MILTWGGELHLEGSTVDNLQVELVLGGEVVYLRLVTLLDDSIAITYQASSDGRRPDVAFLSYFCVIR